MARSSFLSQLSLPFNDASLYSNTLWTVYVKTKGSTDIQEQQVEMKSVDENLRIWITKKAFPLPNDEPLCSRTDTYSPFQSNPQSRKDTQ